MDEEEEEKKQRREKREKSGLAYCCINRKRQSITNKSIYL
jgi:hypothetical protein